MTGFSESSEHVRPSQSVVDLVLVYTGMLRRVPTKAEAGLATAAGASERSATAAPDVVDVARTLLHSTAYAARS